ncbi:MAG: alanyl-tRNA editing protein [Parasporobacterium sp.]|nr:alanyl-tRNA editing protein [Parasporobacterium sp.]
MTEKLYYQDAYLKEFTAEITDIREIEDRTAIVLDRTALYPEGGGQGADHGIIRLLDGGEEISIADVQEEQEEIWHFPETKDLSGFEIGQKVSGTIDWERRFDHMQQHSGEHIISGILCRMFHCDNIGFHLGEDDVTIDYNAAFTFEEALKAEDEANRYIWENHPLVELWPDPEELKTIEYRSKKELEGNVRLTSFPGADTCACCGTHVKASAEVGLLKITSAHKFHEGTRLTLLCGRRAMDFLSMNYHANKKTAVMLSTREEKTPELVKKQIEELVSLKARLSQIKEDYFTLWADHFQGRENALVISDRLEPEEGRQLADLIANNISGTALVFTKVNDQTEDGPVYRYACVNREQDVTGLIQEMNSALSGKGGGRNGFAQGNVHADKKTIEKFLSSF